MHLVFPRREWFAVNLLGEHSAVQALRPLMGLNLQREVKAVCGG